MENKTRLYDVDGNYVGTFEELVELCGMTFIEILEESNEQWKKEHYEVKYNENCPEWEICICKGCKKCYRYDYCDSYAKKDE